jgi:hypothetical protein
MFVSACVCVYVYTRSRVCTRVCARVCVCIVFPLPHPTLHALLHTGPNSVFSSPFFPPRYFLLYSSHLLPNPLSYLALKKPSVQFVC